MLVDVSDMKARASKLVGTPRRAVTALVVLSGMMAVFYATFPVVRDGRRWV